MTEVWIDPAELMEISASLNGLSGEISAALSGLSAACCCVPPTLAGLTGELGAIETSGQAVGFGYASMAADLSARAALIGTDQGMAAATSSVFGAQALTVGAATAVGLAASGQGAAGAYAVDTAGWLGGMDTSTVTTGGFGSTAGWLGVMETPTVTTGAVATTADWTAGVGSTGGTTGAFGSTTGWTDEISPPTLGSAAGWGQDYPATWLTPNGAIVPNTGPMSFGSSGTSGGLGPTTMLAQNGVGPDFPTDGASYTTVEINGGVTYHDGQGGTTTSPVNIDRMPDGTPYVR